MTRAEVERVLNPRGSRYRHVDRAVNLAMRYGWTVMPGRLERACANHQTRTIHVPPVDNDVALAVFAHEGGHLEDSGIYEEQDTVRYLADDGLTHVVVFAAEVFAWTFAIDVLGFRWNKTMQAEMERCLWSYRSNWRHVQTPENRVAMEALVAGGREKAAGVVRMHL